MQNLTDLIFWTGMFLTPAGFIATLLLVFFTLRQNGAEVAPEVDWDSTEFADTFS